MAKRTTWNELKDRRPSTAAARAAYEDEARIAAFREFVYRLRSKPD
jgi:hypothetical protein